MREQQRGGQDALLLRARPGWEGLCAVAAQAGNSCLGEHRKGDEAAAAMRRRCCLRHASITVHRRGLSTAAGCVGRAEGASP